MNNRVGILLTTARRAFEFPMTSLLPPRLIPSTVGSGFRIAAAAVLLVLSPGAAFAHDPTEITTRVYLRTNCLEVRVTIAAQTVIRLLDAAGHSVPALGAAGDVESARPFLNETAAGLFRISAAGKTLVALETNVSLSVEDHVEFKLIYPLPETGSLRFDAVHLAKLPADEPYGAMLTVVDLANNVFLGQKLLTAKEPGWELKMPAGPSPANSSGPGSPP